MKPFHQEIICPKSSEKLEIVINTCVSLIEQHWKKMVEIPQKRDFLSCGILNFIIKEKQFARKYITWLTELANIWQKNLDFIVCHVLLRIVLFY